MRALQWGQGATEDLAAILEWIARDDPAAAERFFRGIREKIERLPEFPFLGTPQPHLAVHPPVRRLVHGSYLIYYSVQARVIRIRAIVHGARLFQLGWLHRR